MSDEIAPSGIAVDGMADPTEAVSSAIEGVVSTVESIEQLHGRSRMVRAVDLTVALILLTSVLPLGCLIIFLITMTGQRPFQAGTSLGRRGREIRWLKFTTARGDASITRLGKLLRTTGLEELPNLINFLTGDMSFVGLPDRSIDR